MKTLRKPKNRGQTKCYTERLTLRFDDTEMWMFWPILNIMTVSLRFGHPAKLLFPSIGNTVTIPCSSYDLDYKRCLQEMDHEGPIF